MKVSYSDGEWDYVEVQIAGVYSLPLVNTVFAVHPSSFTLDIESLINDGYEIEKLPNSGMGQLARIRVDGGNQWVKLRKSK